MEGAGRGKGKCAKRETLSVDRAAASLYNISNKECRSWREGNRMSEIRVGEGESLESALKRFKRKTARAGIMQEARKHEHYEKPSVRRKKKAEAAKKRKY